MSAPGLPELLAKIEQASADCREVIRAAHEASRDLKTLLREAREVIAELEPAAHRAVEDRLVEALAAGLGEYNESIKAAIDEATKAVYARFDQIGNLLLQGDKHTTSREPLDVLVRRSRLAWESGEAAAYAQAMAKRDAARQRNGAES